MSLHKAKGLEADLVVIASCIEGLIPSIDEKKRLMSSSGNLKRIEDCFTLV